MIPSDAALLDHIGRLPHARAQYKQLLKELHVQGAARRDLEHALERLTARGELVETRPGQYTVTRLSREFAVGPLRVHREGYAFVKDIYIPRESARDAMNGDLVVVRIGRVDEHGKGDGEILKILRRAHPTVVGEFRLGQFGHFVIPYDERLGWVEILPGLELPPVTTNLDRVGAASRTVASIDDLDGLIVNVEVIEYPAHRQHAAGRVIEILGHADDFGIDVEIMIRKHHIPHRFPQDVIDEACAIPPGIPEAEIARRRDFRHLPIVTIDGETARDFDDAVYVEVLENGNFALQVHIADVSHYVRPGSAIDLEANLRGTSVYFPDRAVPMLPVELSTDLCSLRPQVDRLVLSALLEIDHRGEVVSQEFCRGVIRSAARMTYTRVHKILEGDEAERHAHPDLNPHFETMRELAGILLRHRQRRGSIDFDLPEPLIEFNEFGEMTGVTRAPRNIAHRLIEEFMLAANEAVARQLDQLAAGLYRIHEKPDPKRVMEFEEVAVHFGYSLGFGAVPVKRYRHIDRQRDGRKSARTITLPDPELAISSRNYQKLIAKIEGKPEERILSYLMLRSLKQARYSPRNQGHFALAAPTYTHFTSPIRRYPDLIVHRLLTAWLDAEASPYGERSLFDIAETSSDTERRAAEAERELVELKKAKFMVDRVGEEFAALIISTQRFGFFVELDHLFIEGLVPIDSLGRDRFRYHENTRKIVGERTQREFAIGQRVDVRLDRVDAVEKRLQFSLVEPESPPKRRKNKYARQT
jgi:ribonuclease R